MPLPSVPLPGLTPGPPPGLAMPGAQPPGMPTPMAQGNPGNTAAAMMKVRDAIKLLEGCLSEVPMGSPLHEKILTSVKSLLAAMPDEDPNMAGPQQTNLLQLLRDRAAQAPMAMLGQLGGGGPSSPGGPMSAAA